MKKSTRFFALCLALTMCATMAMTGAVGETAQPVDATATPVAEATLAPTETAAPQKLDTDVLAVVNGEQVLRADIQPIFKNIMYQYSSYQDASSIEGYAESMALEYTIQSVLWMQKAAENGLDQFTAEEEADFVTKAQTQWAELLDQNYTYFLTAAGQEPTEQEIADAKAKVADELALMGYTAEFMPKMMKESEIQNRVIDFLLKDQPAYTDADIQAEYEKKVQEDKEVFEKDVYAYEAAVAQGEGDIWYVPEGFRGISHILLSVDNELLTKYLDARDQLASQMTAEQALEEEDINPVPEEEVAPAASDAIDIAATPAPTATPEPTPDPSATPTPVPVTQADVDAARQAVLDSIKEKTDAIYSRLAAGESFASLIAEYGEDPGMQSEPYKSEGYSVHKDSVGFIQEFTQGAFAPELQKVGDYGQPVIGSYGVHILYYLRDVPSGAAELNDEKKTALKTEMEETRKNDVLDKAMQEWTDASEITYTGLVPKMDN